MPLPRKLSRAYATALIKSIEQEPKRTNELLDAFIALLKERRHLRYIESLIDAVGVAVEERTGHARICVESQFPLAPQTCGKIDAYLETLPDHDVRYSTDRAAGICLAASGHHWDGRVTTIIEQLRQHLQS